MTAIARIGYVGMTHLGLVSAAAAAAKGFATVAADPDAAVIRNLRGQILPVNEPGLPALAASEARDLRFTADAADLQSCDVVFIAPDVPLDAQGRGDPAIVDTLLAWAGPQLRPDATTVVLSQVPPGFTRARRSVAPNLHYQVETLVFGSAVERALKPERFIVGCADPGQALPQPYASFLAAFGCPILSMRFESAELAKIAINIFLVAQLTATSTLAELCEGLGAAWQEIAPALRLDRRIGAYAYLGAGLGVGGGNLGRDIATARALAAEIGADDSFLRACEANSQHRRDWALARVHEALNWSCTPAIAILGLAYKAGTGSTFNSPGLELATALRGARVSVFDPVVPASAAPDSRAASDALDACQDAEVLAIMTPWDQFRQLDPRRLARAMRGRAIVDPFGTLNAGACQDAGFRYATLGAAPERRA